jgi:ubiquinone/menaquinone biosynthesis C-methylase UbiE
MNRWAATVLSPFRADAGAPELDGLEKLLKKAREPGDQFRNAPYYDIAEPCMAEQWEKLIWPKIRHLDFSCVLDLAAGHGRNSAKLSRVAERIIVLDITQENIDYCRERFRGDDRFTFIKNDGLSLSGVADNSVSLVYSFDSAAHFDSDVLRHYLKETRRVLRTGGSGFIHHSNYTGDPTGSFMTSPHWRNFMSKELFAHYCIKCGLEVVAQYVIDWGDPALDCLSIFRKPDRSAASAA